MSRGTRKDSEKIEVVKYNTNWPDFFTQESQHIQDKLGLYIKKIYHIGSTAIPGMPAKPVIDMILVCNNIDDILLISEKLMMLNYHYPRRQMIPHQSFFTLRQDDNMRYHLHIHERGSPQINRHVNFRDYLIEHPEESRKYATLKINLAKEFENNRLAYVRGKDKLVQEIDAKAKLWKNKKSYFLSSNTGVMAKYWTQEKSNKSIIANFNVFMTHFAQYLNQVELIRIPGYTIVNTYLASYKFNYVLDADFLSAKADEKITEITDYFFKKNFPFNWWISPYDQPEDLGKYLNNNGYHNIKNYQTIYLDLDQWDISISSVSELEIIQAKDKKTLEDFASLSKSDISEAKIYFSWLSDILTQDDPIEYYVGYDQKKPVVRIAICYFSQIAGLYELLTDSNIKKETYIESILAFGLTRAKQQGYHIAVSLMSEEEKNLYRKLNYKTCGVFSRLRHPRKFSSIKG